MTVTVRFAERSVAEDRRREGIATLLIEAA